MSRLCDGIDDQIVFDGVPAQTGAVTILIVARVIVAADNTWLSLVEQEDGGNAKWSLGRRNTGDLYMSNGAALQSAVPVADSDGWCVLAGTRAAGTTTPRNHKCVIGGANVHTNVGGTLGNESAGDGSWLLRIGGNDDPANIRVAAAAVFAANLADADIEGIKTAKTTQSIADLSPIFLADDSNGFAVDLIGGLAATITGTADDADDPAGWVYGLGGGPISVSLTPAGETDAAQAVAFAKPIFKTAGAAVEANAAVALSAVKPIRKTAGAAAEVDVAQPTAFTHTHLVTVLAAAESDAAAALAVTKTILKALGPAGEADAAIALGAARALGLGPAAEADIARTLAGAHGASVAPAAEQDAAAAAARVKVLSLIAAVETDATVGLSIGGPKTLAAVGEQDAAAALTYAKPMFVPLASVAELDQAVAAAAARTRTLGPVAEVDAARALLFAKALAMTLGAASEADVAATVSFVKPMLMALIAAAETDAAAGLSLVGGVPAPTLLLPLRAVFLDRGRARMLDDAEVALVDGPARVS